MEPVNGIANPRVSSPGLTGRSRNPGDAAEYWIPAFAGMTPEIWQAQYRFHFTETAARGMLHAYVFSG